MKSEMVTTLKRQATKILAELHRTKEPVLITEQGMPSAYLIDVDEYEMLQKRMALLENIAQAERDLEAGKVYSQNEVEQSFEKWLK